MLYNIITGLRKTKKQKEVDIMSMSEKTRVAIEELSNKYKGRVFSISELKKVCGVGLITLIKYDAVEVVRSTRLIPISVAELVKRLNECAGDDLYHCSWEYREIDGKAFEVKTELSYKVL